MNKFLIALLSLGLLASFAFVNAANNCEDYCADPENQTMPSGTICYCNPLKDTSLKSITEPIISFIFRVSIVVVPVLILFGAFQIITAGGESEKINQGKKIIQWTLIGFMIVLLSRGFSDLLSSFLGI